MTASRPPIRFRARLSRPRTPSRATWTFLVLPKAASAKLPTRAMTAVEGTLNGVAFRATLEPDGRRSHWLKVPKKLRESSGASVGESVALEVRPSAKQPEPRVPKELRAALASSPEALATWKDITPIARRDWIQWISSAKRAETRERRVATACDMLGSGKRRACCFDRTGIYGGGLSAPEAAD